MIKTILATTPTYNKNVERGVDLIKIISFYCALVVRIYTTIDPEKAERTA